MPIVNSCSVFDDVTEHCLATKLNMIFSVIISKGKVSHTSLGSLKIK